MCNPALLVVLKENVQSLSEKWSELSYLLTEKASDMDADDVADIIDSLSFNPFQVTMLHMYNWRFLKNLCYDPNFTKN
jgi:hypothetical protein